MSGRMYAARCLVGACTAALMLRNLALNTQCFAAWGYPISFEQSKEAALWEAVDSHGQHFVRR